MHFVNIIANNISKIAHNQTVKRFLIELILSAFDTNDYGLLLEWFWHVCIINLNTYENDSVIKSIYLIAKNCSDEEIVDESLESNVSVHFYKDGTYYKSSLFITDFLNIKSNIEINFGSFKSSEKNEYFFE